jgi:stage II sporulation protein AA (anti-sigma F factor antagonist)
MTPPGVTITARPDGDIVLVVVAGEIDLSNADYVEREIATAITNRTMQAAIDLSDVGYIDSVGMRVLYALAGRLETAQIKFKLVAPAGSPARRVIELSGLSSMVEVEPPGPAR